MTGVQTCALPISARIARISFSGELAYEINVEAWYGAHIWEAVMREGKEFGITPYGTETMHVLRAEKGYVILGQDTDGTQTPMDLGMDWIVSKKKDFIGKRSFTRSDTARQGRHQLVGFMPINGQEVIPEGVRALEAANRKFGIGMQFDHFDFASWDYFEKHGKMMPDDWKDQIGGHDAIYFGAVGWPDKIPDHVSLWGSLLLFRREFDQYINLRPARLMPGIIAPVVRKDGTPRAPGEIDMYIVRENTEGEYSSKIGRAHV